MISGGSHPAGSGGALGRLLFKAVQDKRPQVWSGVPSDFVAGNRGASGRGFRRSGPCASRIWRPRQISTPSFVELRALRFRFRSNFRRAPALFGPPPTPTGRLEQIVPRRTQIWEGSHGPKSRQRQVFVTQVARKHWPCDGQKCSEILGPRDFQRLRSCSYLARHFWASSTTFGTCLSKFGPHPTDIAQFRPELARCRSKPAQMRPGGIVLD